MRTPTVVVVTARDDYTADMIIAELHRRRASVLRLDPADEQPIALDARLTRAGWQGTICQGDRTVALDEIGSVLWRWAWAPLGHVAIADPACRVWAAKEDRAGVFGILKALPVRWINHPDRAAAVSKPAQLVVAETIGFATPPTLITHSGASVARWAASANQRHEVLYKAFFSQGVKDGGMVPATRVEPGQLPGGELYAASMFQHLVHGRPARITVVGDRIFAAAIEGTAHEVDWRPTQQLATLREIRPPAETVTKLHRYMTHFGLEYGAFDFIEDSSGTWWFLEINPTGQYGFVEIKAGIKITSAIVDRLCLPANRPVT